jgi:hypothetical protein
MVRLVIVRAVASDSRAIAEAYRRSIVDRPATYDRRGISEVLSSDEQRIRYVTYGSARAGQVRVDGIVTWESDDAWTCRRDVEVNGRPYSWEIERYCAKPREGGSDLTIDCELHARNMLHEMLLSFGKGRLLVERLKELDRWLPPGAHPGGPS